MDGKVEVAAADAYGGVLINDRGRILLREPAGHFGGYIWTFAKGRPEPGETSEETALREVLEETGHPARIIALIPAVFPGRTSSTVFFLMEPEGVPGPFSHETVRIRWVNEKAARRLINRTRSRAGRERDLLVLKAALVAWRDRR
jgi:8-oxo-dGTP pyrophosphatase MutT (NUDIX family)